MLLIFVAYAANADTYVGGDRCATCHQKEYRVWKKGPHASAQKNVEASTSQSCFHCHSTGQGPAATQLPLPNVQCEACHGAGMYYAKEDVMRNRVLAIKLGMRELAPEDKMVAMCQACHRDDVGIGKKFNAVKSWKRIGH